MRKEEVKKWIDDCHKKHKKAAIYFCSFVPVEILEAAGFQTLQITHLEENGDLYPEELPKNVCPIVRECCEICESGILEQADLIIAESSCDGKKKMFELLKDQSKVYYYQVPQGEEQEYALPLIASESRYLIKMLEQRFGITVTDEAIRKAANDTNRQRASAMDLLAVQQQVPPCAWGMEVYEKLQENMKLPTSEERIAANEKVREEFLGREEKVPETAPRILLTGCPIGGVYQKIIEIVEKNGGVVVCFENCECIKSNIRFTDVKKDDIIASLAECYQNTACAIMTPNQKRKKLLEQLVTSYQIAGILDIHLQPCHAYTVEKYSVEKHFSQQGIPYAAIETGYSDADKAQLSTRIAAFLEILQ